MAITTNVELLKGWDNQKERAQTIVKVTVDESNTYPDSLHLKDVLAQVGVDLDKYRYGHCWVKITPNMSSYTDESISVRHVVGVDNLNSYINLNSKSATSAQVIGDMPITVQYSSLYNQFYDLRPEGDIYVFIGPSGTAPDYTIELYYILWK